MDRKECYHWYWGNSSTPPETCLHPKHRRQLCEGVCKDYLNTHKETAKHLKELFKPKERRFTMSLIDECNQAYEHAKQTGKVTASLFTQKRRFEMGYRAGEDYYTHYVGGRDGQGGQIQCEFCEHNWIQRGWKLPKRCPNCGRKLCSSIPCR